MECKLYEWAMSQKLPVNKFKWIEESSQFNADFIKSEEWYFLEVDVQYLGRLYELHSDLPFLLERKKLEKFEKLVANLEDNNEYVVHI